MPFEKLRVRTLSVLLLSMGLAGCIGGGGEDDAGLSASFTVTENADGTFRFDASNSTGSIVEYQWNFGDGTLVFDKSKKVDMEYTITNAIPWVSLVVVGAGGKRDFALTQVTLGTGENTKPELHVTDSARWVRPGTAIVLDASQSDDHDNDGFTFEWLLGPYVDPAPETATYDSGLMAPEASVSQVYDTEGVYLIHCHPHPWMIGRIVVDANATATNSTLAIENFAFNQGEAMVVAPGTEIVMENLDPIEHSVTTFYAAPGAKTVNSDRQMVLGDLAEGNYQATLVLDDRKPDFPTFQSWGLKVSADAPVVEFGSPAASSSDALTPATDTSRTHAFPAPVLFNANITTELSFTLGPNGGNVRFEIVRKGDLVQAQTATCPAGKCTLQSNLLPNEYSWRVVQQDQTVVSDYSITVPLFKYYTKPGFGDAGSGQDEHAHH